MPAILRPAQKSVNRFDFSMYLYKQGKALMSAESLKRLLNFNNTSVCYMKIDLHLGAPSIHIHSRLPFKSLESINSLAKDVYWLFEYLLS